MLTVIRDRVSICGSFNEPGCTRRLRPMASLALTAALVNLVASRPLAGKGGPIKVWRWIMPGYLGWPFGSNPALHLTAPARCDFRRSTSTT